jgi:hypothetical protein
MRIGFYTLGSGSLPHPSYPLATLRIVEAAILEAWRLIRDHPEGDFDIGRADEDRITRELRTCLVNAVLYGGRVPGFTPKHFRVNRESKFVSFDGTHLDKMPDLHIDILRDDIVSIPSDDGLFVECKPVDRDHPAGGAYCDKGIRRFVSGEYAWALTEGLMVGYASPGYTVPQKLEEAIRTRKGALKVVGSMKACPGSSALGYCQHPHITVHRRGFPYPGTKKRAPRIVLRHLWLDRG